MKRFIPQSIQWCVAGVIAAFCVNLLLFGYNRPAGWIDRTNGATDAIWNPNSIVVHGTEGYGIHKIDENGYLNDALPLHSGYVLCVGSSHTQAKEMQRSQSYCSRLNALLGGTADDPKVYNASQDNYYLPRIIQNFPCILSEFPGIKTIVIEIPSTSFTPQELTDALSQSVYDPNSRGDRLPESLSLWSKLKISVKEAAPILSLAKLQLLALRPTTAASNSDSFDRGAYVTALDTALSLIRSQFDGEIIILFHPPISIQTDGSLEIGQNETTRDFEAICRKNNIAFLNLQERFVSGYMSEFHVPYGFNNTTMGTGHLNSIGHKMMAEELFAFMCAKSFE